MNYQEYDIVRIDNKEYVIAKTSEINSNKYLLLVRIDEEENVCSDDILISDEEKASIYPMLKDLLEES